MHEVDTESLSTMCHKYLKPEQAIKPPFACFIFADSNEVPDLAGIKFVLIVFSRNMETSKASSK